MFEVSFSQVSRKVEFFRWRRLSSFFLSVSSLLRLAQWFVWASYRVRFVLSFCQFVVPLMGKAEWGVLLSADDWVCILFSLLFRWGVLHRVLLVVGWCQVLYSSMMPGLQDARSCIQLTHFLCVSSHYLMLPRASSLVV